MSISLHKNLKIIGTSDEFIRDMSNTYDFLKNYLIATYPDDENHEITYADILIAASNTVEVSYINLPLGATFKWFINGKEITTPTVQVLSGTTIDYELTYSNYTRARGSQLIVDDFIFNLDLLEPNQYLVSITSDKLLKEVTVSRKVGEPDQHSYVITSFDDNSYSFYADNNEVIRFIPLATGYSYYEHSLDIIPNVYTYTITENTNCMALFPYEAWEQLTIWLKNNDGSLISDISPYWDNITFSGDTSRFDYKRERYTNSFVAWVQKNTPISWTINISGYAPINNSTTITTINFGVEETLVPMYNCTIIPYPDNSIVTLSATGYTTVSGIGEQTITVAKGTTVTWSVVNEPDWKPKSGNIPVNAPVSERKELEEKEYKVNIDDYEYTLVDGILTLTKYVGSSTTPKTPGLENL